MTASVSFAAIIVLCLVLSFLFSGMEAGVFALSRIRIRQLMRGGDKRAKVLFGFLQETERFLWTILVGNTLANFTVVTLTVAGVYRQLGDYPFAAMVIFVVVAFFLYAVCDLLPKMLFRQFPNRLCLAVARPFRLIHIVLSPLVSLLDFISDLLLRWTGGQTYKGQLFGSRDEFRMAVQESGSALTSEERTMITRVLDLQKARVRHIALPMSKVTTVPVDLSTNDLLALCRQTGHARFPVLDVKGQPKKIVGIVSVYSVLFSREPETVKTVGNHLQSALYLNEDVPLEEAFRRLQRAGQRLAIVLSRDRRETGIISLQDILKSIFGDVNL
jgi:CBS domain containing-hemolysin-like protein